MADPIVDICYNCAELYSNGFDYLTLLSHHLHCSRQIWHNLTISISKLASRLEALSAMMAASSSATRMIYIRSFKVPAAAAIQVVTPTPRLISRQIITFSISPRCCRIWELSRFGVSSPIWEGARVSQSLSPVEFGNSPCFDAPQNRCWGLGPVCDSWNGNRQCGVRFGWWD
jgi:hypothetical protein